MGQSEQSEIVFKKLRQEIEETRNEKNSMKAEIQHIQQTMQMVKRSEEEARKRVEVIMLKIK